MPRLTSFGGARGFGRSGRTPNRPPVIEYFLLGGGGGGGTPGASRCGGGGAGGYLLNTNYSGHGVTLSISVGAGGSIAATGGNSSLDSVIAYGGGLGSSNVGQVGGNGGSGGGGNRVSMAGGSPVSGQGNAGGYGSSSGSSSDSGGGGGGGAGGPGDHLTPNAFTNEPGPPGPGLQNSITGTATWYAEGGTGSGFYDRGIYHQNLGGNISSSGHINGNSATGSGGGGGKNSTAGGAGGSGLVVIAYPNTYPAPYYIDPGLVYTQPSRSGYRVYRFTSGQGTVQF